MKKAYFSITPSRRIISFLLAIVAIAGIGIGTSDQAKAENGQAFSISPPLLELNANPGQRTTAQIKLTNVSSGTLKMSAQVNDFGSKNETGEPNIIFDDKESTPYAMKSWVVVPGDFTLKSQETRTLNVPINIPRNAEPGGHYAVIRFTGINARGESQEVSLAASIGTLVLLRVSGDVQQSAKIEDFYSAFPNFDKSSFFESSPVSLVTRIRNDGNIHVKPTGTITVKDMFGKEVSSVRMNGDPTNDKNLPGSILPQSVRRFDTVLNDGMIGRYSATMKLNYGDGKTLEQTTNFWVVPYRAIIAGIFALALVVFGLVWGIKRYNAYIIKKAKAASTPPDTKE